MTRVGLLSVGVLIAVIESGGFSHGLGWISALAAFFFILPAIFGGRTRG